jgi:hypothetical protein
MRDLGGRRIEPPIKGDSASSSDRTGWGRYAKTLNDRFWRKVVIHPQTVSRGR